MKEPTEERPDDDARCEARGSVDAVRLLLLADGRCTSPHALELLRAARWRALEITQVATPAELDRVLAQPDFDAVLIEWSRSPSSAIEPLARVQRLAPRLPVVILAEQPCGREGICTDALKAGAQDALLKTEVTPALLERSLHFAIERQRARQKVSVLLAQSEAARARAEHAWERASFAAHASGALIATLDLASTSHAVAEQAVRGLADFCVIDLVEADGSVRRKAVAHADPARQPLAAGLLSLPLQPDRPHLTAEALRTGEPRLVPGIMREHLASIADGADCLALLEQLGVRSYVAVPLLARGRLLGAMFLARTRDRVPFDGDDLASAQELAEHAALAIDNARLHTEAQEAIAARNSVLRNVAHDLRNPLNGIRMTADLLLDAPPAPEQLARYARIIRRAAVQMDRLIQDLLDVARLDAGQLALDRALLSPARLVHQAVELNAPIAAARSHTLTSEIPSETLPPIDVDAQRMLQVLGNLIDNAIKFTPQGGSITVGVTVEDEEIRFSVRDSGIGMSEGDLAHLFRPFWQARRGGRQGAGLGLAISKAIVEAHGGRITAVSAPGQGSTFTVHLPAAAERRHCG